jgi:hypothetical protein
MNPCDWWIPYVQIGLNATMLVACYANYRSVRAWWTVLREHEQSLRDIAKVLVDLGAHVSSPDNPLPASIFEPMWRLGPLRRDDRKGH